MRVPSELPLFYKPKLRYFFKKMNDLESFSPYVPGTALHS